MPVSNFEVRVLRNKYVQTIASTLSTALFGYGYYEFIGFKESIRVIGYNFIVTILVYTTIFSAIFAAYSWLRLVKRLRKLINTV